MKRQNRIQPTLDLFVSRKKIAKEEVLNDSQQTEAEALSVSNTDLGAMEDSEVDELETHVDSIELESTESKANEDNKADDVTDVSLSTIRSTPTASTSTATTAGIDRNVSASTYCDSTTTSYNVHDDNRNDIGRYISSISSIDDRTKCELLERHWKPPSNYEMPFSTHRKKVKMKEGI
jgi:hypothetical protein